MIPTARTLIVLTIAVLVTAICKAGEPGTALQAGSATGNITPHLGISINGYFNDRKAARIHDELHVRCLVLDDGSNRLAIAVCDSCMLPADLLDRAKAAASARANIRPECILISATHTHFAPAAMAILQSEPDAEYIVFLEKRIADTIVRAVQNLAPAELAFGKGSVPGQVFNRRWKMRPGSLPPNPFGATNDVVKMNPPIASPDMLEPAGPTDPEVCFVSVRKNGGGAPIAVLANYSLHYVGGGGATDISADYFGAVCEMLERKLGRPESDPPFVAIMSNGTSGNINNIDFRTKRPPSPPYTQNRVVASAVVDEILRAYDGLSYTSAVMLDARTRKLQLATRRPDQQELARAKGILEKAGGRPLRSMDEYYAFETVKMAEYPAQMPVLVQAFRIGSIGVAAIPCEVFVETGLAIKKESPLEANFTIELANGAYGYLPTPQQHELGGYETWRARSSYLETQAEPKIREAVLGMMRELAPR